MTGEEEGDELGGKRTVSGNYSETGFGRHNESNGSR